jgi:hypothetical protein
LNSRVEPGVEYLTRVRYQDRLHDRM